jgi:hypothetical protein
VTFREKKEAAEVDACFREFYAASPMVRVLSGAKSNTKLPQIQYSVRTNYCDIGFKLAKDGRRCIVVSCLDNLLKGRSRAGGREHEPDVRMGRNGGPGMKFVVKLGGSQRWKITTCSTGARGQSPSWRRTATR